MNNKELLKYVDDITSNISGELGTFCGKGVLSIQECLEMIVKITNAQTNWENKNFSPEEIEEFEKTLFEEMA